MSFLNKRVTNKGLIIALIITLAVVAVGGFVTAGFTIFRPDEIKDHFTPGLNEANLYTAEHLTIEDTNTGYGVKIDVQDNGSIKLNGKASAEISKTFAMLSLNKGTYTLTAVDGSNIASYYVTADVGGEEFKADFTPDNTFEVIADNTTVALTLHIAKDADVSGVVVYPVIVSGEEAGSFFE